MTAIADTPLALEMRSYFAARQLCLAATPPCVTRPCDRHHAESAARLGATSCPSCVVGLDAAGEPCPSCDGYGRIWPNASAVASTLATGGTAAAGAGVDGAAGRVLGPPSGQVGGSTLQTDNQPRTVNPRLAEGGPVRPQNESMP